MKGRKGRAKRAKHSHSHTAETPKSTHTGEGTHTHTAPLPGSQMIPCTEAPAVMMCVKCFPSLNRALCRNRVRFGTHTWTLLVHRSTVSVTVTSSCVPNHSAVVHLNTSQCFYRVVCLYLISVNYAPCVCVELQAD